MFFKASNHDESTLGGLISIRNSVRAMLLADLEYQEEIDRLEKELSIVHDSKIGKTVCNLETVKIKHSDHKAAMFAFNAKRGNFLEFIPALCEGTSEGKRKALMYLLTLIPEMEEMRDG